MKPIEYMTIHLGYNHPRKTRYGRYDNVRDGLGKHVTCQMFHFLKRHFFFLFYFILGIPHRPNWWTDFDDRYVVWLRRDSAQRCAFWGRVDTAPHFRGTWIGVFKPDAQNIQTLVLSKLLQRFQPNFAQWYRLPNTLRDWYQNLLLKSNMANGRHVEKKFKSLYLSNCFIDFNEILHSDTHWVIGPYEKLKFSIFLEIQHGRRPPSWKFTKKIAISSTPLGRFWWNFAQ